MQEAFKSGAIRSFARHSRLGYTDLDDSSKVREAFVSAVEYLRGLGYKRITLKTGAYGMEALAMAIGWQRRQSWICSLWTDQAAAPV